jgi:glutamate-1-semialdehyde 2,1-aminomutase
MPENWTFNKLDEKIAGEIANFLPERIFDSHAHIWRNADLEGLKSGAFTEGPEETTIEVWREHIGRHVGKNRLAGGLFIGLPMCNVDRMNSFLTLQLKDEPESRGLICISPEYPKEKALEYLENPLVAGFKPYHLFSKEIPTFQSSISGFLPEWAWKMADDRSLVITLHIVKDLALADPENQREIRAMCRKYPNARLVLAHAARGFHAPNTVKGLSSLRELENVWFDTSAICETAAITAILREFGPRKLLWGSDFCVSEMRGKSVTAGDGFVWLSMDTVKWDKLSPSCKPTLVGLESLLALKQAADDFGLNDDDLQDIFCDNAYRVLGIAGKTAAKEPGTITQDLYVHAKKIIPGGTQLLSKRPEMLAPDQWPAYFREARGCEVWDLDGRHYYDMASNGIGSCLLGYRDPDVTRAVQRRINLGAMSTLNPPEEVELADLLLEIHPWAERVRYARTGGEAMAVATRIARATTDRSIIAVCGYSGWHDWYLAANLGEDDSLRGHLLPGLEPLGVPRELRGTTTVFRYNNREDFQAVIDRYGSRLAAVIMEACRSSDPEPGFLEYIRDEAHKAGALLVFDEISIGWRLHFGGSHLKLGVNPDIAVFAKALGNGHPMAAIIGTAPAMEGAHSSFISSTYWTESVGPTAALAAIRKMMKIDVPAHVSRMGNKVIEHWRTCAKRYGLPVTAGDGYPCLAHFGFDHELGEEMRTLYTQLMLKRGFLGGVMLYPALSHTDEIIDRYGSVIDEVFDEIADALKSGDVKTRLEGPVAHKGFARLT